MATEVVTEVATSGVLGTLGINWKLLIAQLVNFGIVLLVLWRWVWRPMIRLLGERTGKIEHSLKEAARIDAEARDWEGKRATLLREAEQKAAAIIEEAARTGETARKELVEKARAEVEKVVLQGKESLRGEKARMLEEARIEIADVVVAATGRVLEETIDEKRNRKLIDRVIAALR